MADTDIITNEKRQQFPTKAGEQQRYLDLPTNPSVARRWINLKDNAVDIDFLWMGKCISCEHTMWTTLDADTRIANYLNKHYIAEPFQDDEEHENRPYRSCLYCSTNRPSVIKDNGRQMHDAGEDYEPITWPEQVFAEVRRREAEARAKQAKWIEAVPMEPAVGAAVYLRDEKKVTFFEGWIDGKAKVAGYAEPLDQEKVLTLIPAIFGVMHDNLVSLPEKVLKGAVSMRDQIHELIKGAGNDPVEATVVRWAFGSHHHTVTCRNTEGQTVTYSADGVACFVPSVNPATENSDQVVERLHYKQQRTEYAIHARLVAEGQARGWCETFDPILVSQGLDPRSGKKVVTGTVKVVWQFDTKDYSESTIDSILKNHESIKDYIPASAFQEWDLTVDTPEQIRLLS